jgi:hypothetical protein
MEQTQNPAGDFLSFEEARKLAHSLKFKSAKEWAAWRRSGKCPKNIPAQPTAVYKENWISWADWLGDSSVKISGVNLGAWVRRQRQLYRAGKLSQQKIDLLNSMPGWNWGNE